MNLIEGGFPVERRPADHARRVRGRSRQRRLRPPPPLHRRTAHAPVAPGCRSARSGRATASASSPTCWRWTSASRYLRFGYQASDAQIGRYVDTLDFEHDEVFGIFNRRLELIAMAHLAYRQADAARGRSASAEFGVSVAAARAAPRLRPPPVRARDAARAQPRRRVDLHPRAEREHGDAEDRPRCRRHGSSATAPNREAWLTLPPDSIASHLDEFLGERAAELDYRLKHHAHHMENLFKRSEKA